MSPVYAHDIMFILRSYQYTKNFASFLFFTYNQKSCAHLLQPTMCTIELILLHCWFSLTIIRLREWALHYYVHYRAHLLWSIILHHCWLSLTIIWLREWALYYYLHNRAHILFQYSTSLMVFTYNKAAKGMSSALLRAL